MVLKPKISIPLKLQTFIKHVWYIDGIADVVLPTFADGNPGIIFQQFGTGSFDCSKHASIPPNYVFGQTVKPISLEVAANSPMIGVIFHPHVLQSIFRFNAKEITDDFVDLNLLPARPRISLSEQLWD